MKVLVDCTNAYSGGARTHIREIFSRVALGPENVTYTIIGAEEILSSISAADERIVKWTTPMLNRGRLLRHFWRAFFLRRIVLLFDLVFYPGGTVIGNPKKSITMCRNMLPFMREEYARYGLSSYYIRNEVLRVLQRRSFMRATGVIFLSKFAHDAILDELHISETSKQNNHRLIPHGITEKFRVVNRPQQRPFQGSTEQITLLYVSSFDVYKNQDTVLRAVKNLRDMGRQLTVRFIGPRNPIAFGRFSQLRVELDPECEWTEVEEEVSQDDLVQRYSAADIFVYASTCENLPNILLEAMVSRVPIVCSDSRPMSDVLGGGGIYFEPRNVSSLASAIEKAIASSELRESLAEIAYDRATVYSWDRCARDTFEFIRFLLNNEMA